MSVETTVSFNTTVRIFSKTFPLKITGTPPQDIGNGQAPIALDTKTAKSYKSLKIKYSLRYFKVVRANVTNIETTSNFL